MAIREEIRLLSNADAVAAAGLLPTQSAEKAHATGIEKVYERFPINYFFAPVI